MGSRHGFLPLEGPSELFLLPQLGESDITFSTSSPLPSKDFCLLPSPLVYSACFLSKRSFYRSPCVMCSLSSFSLAPQILLMWENTKCLITLWMEVVGDTDHKTQRNVSVNPFTSRTIIKVGICFLMPLALNTIINTIKLLIKQEQIHRPIKFVLTILFIYDDDIWKKNHGRCHHGSGCYGHRHLEVSMSVLLCFVWWWLNLPTVFLF